MREKSGLPGRVSTKLKAALVALIAVFAVSAIGASSASAAANDPFEVEFNHVGLYIGIGSLGSLDELVLDPTTDDGEGNLLGSLKFKGTYTDDAGNFTLPKATGLEFPTLALDIEGVKINGGISLAEDGSGTYDASTGKLDLNAKLALVLGADKIEDLGLPIPGSGALSCEFAPLDLSFSTANGWPHAGEAFGDKANLEEGAIAGAFTYKPDVKSLIEENAGLCDLLGGFLDPVGGIWLGNYAAVQTEMPAASGPKPGPTPCPAGTTGNYPHCKQVPVDECPEGQVGTPPDCKDIVTPGAVGAVKVTPKKAKVKAGKAAKLKIKVSNTGGEALKAKIKIKSSNKKVKAPKTVSVTIQPGKTVTKTIKVKAAKKAKGKAKITATVAGKKGVATLTVKKAKKKKRKK